MISASPRKAREDLYRRLNIKAKSSGATGFRLATKADVRFKRFHELLVGTDPIPEELLSELTRSYLYTRRGLLSDALDFFGVPHDGGLTDQNLDFLAELPEDRVAACETHLRERGHSLADIELYLCFMNIKK